MLSCYFIKLQSIFFLSREKVNLDGAQLIQNNYKTYNSFCEQFKEKKVTIFSHFPCMSSSGPPDPKKVLRLWLFMNYFFAILQLRLICNPENGTIVSKFEFTHRGWIRVCESCACRSSPPCNFSAGLARVYVWMISADWGAEFNQSGKSLPLQLGSIVKTLKAMNTSLSLC